MLAWPSISWTERSSAPLRSKVVAKVWRNTWGVTGRVMPARIPLFLTMISMEVRERRRCSPDKWSLSCWACAPRELRNNGRKTSVRVSRYFCTASAALSVTNTTRTFFPFPMTANSRSFRFTFSTFRSFNSLTRSPVEYSSSIMARSRRLICGFLLQSVSRRRSSSSWVIPATSRGSFLTSSILSGASRFFPKSRLIQYLRKVLIGMR